MSAPGSGAAHCVGTSVGTFAYSLGYAPTCMCPTAESLAFTDRTPSRFAHQEEFLDQRSARANQRINNVTVRDPTSHTGTLLCNMMTVGESAICQLKLGTCRRRENSAGASGR